jgi:serine/threonine-protein kinase
MYQHMTNDPKPLTELLPDLHPGIWAAIRRSLRRRKEERYASAEEMADDLRHPEKVDLKWIDEADPPMTAILPSRQTNWLIICGSALLAAILALLFVFLRSH